METRRIFACAAAPVLATLASGSAFANEAEQVIARHEAAYHARNMSAFLATYAPDAKVTIDGAQTYSGHAQIRAVYALNFAPTAPKVTVVDRKVSGNTVTDSESMDFGNGMVVCCSTAEYHISGGKIVRVFLTTPR